MPEHNACAKGDDPRRPNEEIPEEHLPPLPVTGGPVKLIMVSAVSLSSHGMADWDALAVEVFGFDRFGRMTPLRGTLRVTLRGQSQQLVRVFGTRFIGDPGANKTLATWSRSVGGADRRMILPLPRPLPEHDLRIAPYGQLHVRLLSPGRGVFEATSAVIPLRQVGALRTRSLVKTGSRFFVDELTHDSRRPTGLHIVNPSAIRLNGRVLVMP